MGVRGPAPVHELAVDAAHLYLPVGAAWFVASRAGWEPLGFDALITALTAVHFHFAGLAAPAIAGQVGRLLVAPGPAYRLGAGLVALTPLLVALGILGSPVLEVAMASLLAAGVVLVAGVVLFQVAPHHGHAGRALAASQLVSLYTMGLAVRFAWGEFSGVPALGIAEMITSHGRLNALGFALPSLALLAWLAPPREAWPDAIPLPALRAGLRVGPGWYAAAGWAAPAGTPGPTGLLPSLADFLGREFPGTEVDPDLARYYEDPSSLDLVVRPRWAPGFRLAGWLVETLAARVGQLVLPGGTETRRITHALIPLARPVPGLEDAVGSYRAYESGGPMFVAIYGTHQDATSTYMDVALPLPGGTLHSVLRGEPLPGEPPGLRLSSTRGPDRPAGHEGLWWRLGPLVLRLPLHEELEAWPARAPGATATAGFGGGLDAVMLARHRFRVLGIPCLRLEYELLPARPADA